MEIAILVFLAAAIIGLALVARARGAARSWDQTDAWDAVKRVGEEASRGKREDKIRRPPTQ